MKTPFIHIYSFILTLLFTSLVSCGGGSSTTASNGNGGIGGTGITAAGQITGFGSIFVNGIEFETNNAVITINNQPATENDLRLGMYVAIKGSLDTSGNTGAALNIRFEKNLEGPITSITTSPDGQLKTLNVLGTSIIADSISTVFDNVSFDTLQNGDTIEISGLIDNTGALKATRIEKKGIFTPGSQVDIKGSVSNLTATQFSIGSQTIDFSNADLSDVPNQRLVNGIFVHVKGSLSGTLITASEVEQENGLFDENETNVSLEGIITDFIDTGNFRVSGQLIDASQAILKPQNLQLTNGANIEVKGAINNGTLLAEKIKARDGNIKLEAVVSELDTTANTLTLGFFNGTVIVKTNSSTTITRDNHQSISLNELTPGMDFVKIRGFLDIDNTLVASEIQIKQDTGDDKIEAPIMSLPGTGASNITLLGINFTTDNMTEFEDDDTISSTTFYSRLILGQIISIKDKTPHDGIADKAEIEE